MAVDSGFNRCPRTKASLFGAESIRGLMSRSRTVSASARIAEIRLGRRKVQSPVRRSPPVRELGEYVVRHTFPNDVEIIAPTVLAAHGFDIAVIAHDNHQAGVSILGPRQPPQSKIVETDLRKEAFCWGDRVSKLNTGCMLRCISLHP